MSAQPLEIRMARLEGAYEQIDRRLVDLRQDMNQRFAAVDQHFATLERRVDDGFQRLEDRFQRVDQRFMWLAGLVVSTWITTILTVVFHH